MSTDKSERSSRKAGGTVSCLVKDFPLNSQIRCRRGGVIVYTHFNGTVYFSFGIDAKTHDLTDFGGGIGHRDASPISGALREFSEETLGIFGTVTVDQIGTCPVIYDLNNLIIFLRFDLNPEEVSTVFLQKYQEIVDQIGFDPALPSGSGSLPSGSGSLPSGSGSGSGSGSSSVRRSKKKIPEVCGITWLTWPELQTAIRKKIVLYEKVRYFLERTPHLDTLL